MLNEAQEKAVFAEDTYIFLLAGAGSGKTRVIVERIRHLLSKGVRPDVMLAITFTRKAAEEMSLRIDESRIRVSTFHKYCYDLLSAYENIEIADEKIVGFTEDELLKISNFKNSYFKKKKPRCYDRYQSFLKMHKLKDYDDLLLEAFDRIGDHTYQYIFIDEFQDTNSLQYILLKKMLKGGVKGFAVGDPDQSIYAFRGADMHVIKSYIKDYDAKVYLLSENYRSYQKIVACANCLISHNKDRFKKKLVPTHTSLGTVDLIVTDDIFTQVMMYIKYIRKQTYDIAILYRFHHLAYGLKQRLENQYMFDIKYLSMHEAKGLEFDCVIILGADHMPYLKNYQYRTIEEERRLLFVAVTRARHYLCLINTHHSQFTKEIKC